MKHVDQSSVESKHGVASPVDAAGETIAAGNLSHNGQAAPVVAHAKICCVCGTDVANERRYKDAQGRYWCCDCAKADSAKVESVKHQKTAECADCRQHFAPAELVEHEGTKVCAPCRDRRTKQAKREAARVAAAAEEAAAQKAQQKKAMTAAGVFVAAAVLYLVYRMFFK